MNKYQIFIDGKEYTNATFPLKYGEFLDEQLDYATLTLSCVSEPVFAPTTPVRIVVTSENGDTVQTKTLHYVVSDDKFQEIFSQKQGDVRMYKHELTLIEPTKLLEGIQVESLCFTNASGMSNGVNPIDTYKVVEPGGTNNIDIDASKIRSVFFKAGFVTPMWIDENIQLPTVSAFALDDYSTEIQENIDFIDSLELVGVIRDTDEKEIYVFNYSFGGQTDNVSYIDENVKNACKWERENKKEGAYTIEYRLSAGVTFSNMYGNTYHKNLHCNFLAGFVIRRNKLTLAPWTIQSVIERVLDLERPLVWNKDDGYVKQRRFKFDIPAGHESVFNKVSPEFTFSRQTLREVLRTIGGYIHAEPRLLYNEDTGDFDTITFDFYGEQEYAEYINTQTGEQELLSKYNYEGMQGSYGIEQANTALDSYVDNLVNRLNASESTMGQPYKGGYQTFRTEQVAVRYEDAEGSMYFPTYYPISQIHKFEWIDRTGITGEENKRKAYDITHFLYEEKIYNSQLSSYEAVYPISKAYALYYTQGQKGIKGFFFKNKEFTDGVFAKYSIVNILRAVAEQQGQTISLKEELSVYRELCFRLTYTPIYSARIGHSKSYIGDWLKYPRVLNYSQGANMVETEYYGENIKGAVERLGTIEKTYTFTCFNIDTIPKAGLLWDDDYYIASVSVEVMQNKFKVSVGLSKNFNRISQYIGVSSYKRLYEVSEVMVQARETMYRDYVVVTDFDEILPSSTATKDCFINSGAMKAFANTFNQNTKQDDGTKQYGEIVKVQAQGFTKGYEPLPVVTLPVIVSAEGNVIEFSWEYQDNYSAGQKTILIDAVDENKNTSKSYYGQDVQYCDYYGRLYYEQFNIMAEGSDGIDGTTDRRLFPLGSSTGRTVFGQIGDTYILRRKDSRETMKNNYVVEFVTDNKDFIIGSALAANCPLVKGITGKKARLYVFGTRINKFSRKIDTAKAKNFWDIDERDLKYDETRNIVYYKGLPSSFWNPLYKSWAIVTAKTEEVDIYQNEDGTTEQIITEDGGELLIGRNGPVSENGRIGAFMLVPTHDVYEYLKAKNKQGENQ